MSDNGCSVRDCFNTAPVTAAGLAGGLGIDFTGGITETSNSYNAGRVQGTNEAWALRNGYSGQELEDYNLWCQDDVLENKSELERQAGAGKARRRNENGTVRRDVGKQVGPGGRRKQRIPHAPDVRYAELEGDRRAGGQCGRPTARVQP